MVVRPRGGGDRWWSLVVWGDEGGGAVEEERRGGCFGWSWGGGDGGGGDQEWWSRIEIAIYPAVMNTRSEPLKEAAIACFDSSAACSPKSGFPPLPALY
ncbi:hypothetical protein RHSIM_Rhsim13G0132400 [Rhododendron simsii]|uniref:Uncharacterized protein n=1 Tax=Rhododendron simsii TaxID=118357 RepID=A0A834L427_RHOSS|nr:hypothetical protein RHSIM_Rhsim13G0132400 [Rhododendron simsii]